eukprot:Protomagalhaensia_sp_Gyna_25__3764@NODE_3381_length_597_cov_1327_933692_g2837_i0_p1_GENE_NODE_3381_length_597_cov_1327_933692_g2837_i0NODE_3381_length_597_cov_1327_933692_g2837_i0_p1_ORF_typecomplete_len160_score32_25Glnsynt_C/PF00120_24/4_6e09_NODE_3381_length_597_cov_1327_933692_g2837_i0118561
MAAVVNPLEKEEEHETTSKQTVEIRSGDTSADVYRFLACLAVAVRHGFEMPDALEVADRTYVDVNIHKAEHKETAARFESLPASCAESAEALERQAAIYEGRGVFSKALIHTTVIKLKSFDDLKIREKVQNNPDLMLQMVREFYYCG